MVNGEKKSASFEQGGRYTLENVEIEIYEPGTGYSQRHRFSINGIWGQAKPDVFTGHAFSGADVTKVMGKVKATPGSTEEAHYNLALVFFKIRLINNGRLTQSSFPAEFVKQKIREEQDRASKPEPKKKTIVLTNNSSSSSSGGGGLILKSTSPSTTGKTIQNEKSVTSRTTANSNRTKSRGKTLEQMEYERQAYRREQQRKIQDAIDPTRQAMQPVRNYFDAQLDRINRENEAKSAALDRKLEAQKRARERTEREEEAKIAAILASRARIDEITQNTNAIFQRYKTGEIPTSATRVQSNKLYYFIYTNNLDSFTGIEIDEGKAVVRVSNVFAIGQYPDGTWPMANTIQAEINDLTSHNGQLHGYYISEQEAQTVLNNFKNEIQNAGIRIENNIVYTGKNANEQQQHTTGNKQQLDYWGNPIKKTNTTQTKQTATPQKQQTKKPKLDYWGNPVKE
ncbi:hypothetical protein DN748_08870 [Sinomicrobium soli]|nr:hypothetical protein DN748_08870 [Sinomicrobium sp. N-1-3-6]